MIPLGLILAASAVIYSSGRRAAATDKALEAIEDNTKNLYQTLVQTPSILNQIQNNTDKLPEISICMKAVFERTMSTPIYSEMKKDPNPHDLPVCIKLLPEEIRNEVDRIVKENLDKSDADLTAIMVRELDFNLILKTSEERKVSIDKCLKNLGSYAKNKKVNFSQTK